jgi:hypothetical protein
MMTCYAVRSSFLPVDADECLLGMIYLSLSSSSSTQVANNSYPLTDAVQESNSNLITRLQKNVAHRVYTTMVDIHLQYSLVEGGKCTTF